MLHQLLPPWSNNDTTKIYAFVKQVPLTEQSLQVYVAPDTLKPGERSESDKRSGGASLTEAPFMASPEKKRYRIYVQRLREENRTVYWYLPSKVYTPITSASHKWRGYSFDCMRNPVNTLAWRKNIAYLLRSLPYDTFSPVDKLAFALHWNGIHMIRTRQRPGTQVLPIPYRAYERGDVIHTLDQYTNLWLRVRQNAQNARL